MENSEQFEMQIQNLWITFDESYKSYVLGKGKKTFQSKGKMKQQHAKKLKVTANPYTKCPITN